MGPHPQGRCLRFPVRDDEDGPAAVALQLFCQQRPAGLPPARRRASPPGGRALPNPSRQNGVRRHPGTGWPHAGTHGTGTPGTGPPPERASPRMTSPDKGSSPAWKPGATATRTAARSRATASTALRRSLVSRCPCHSSTIGVKATCTQAPSGNAAPHSPMRNPMPRTERPVAGSLQAHLPVLAAAAHRPPLHQAQTPVAQHGGGVARPKGPQGLQLGYQILVQGGHVHLGVDGHLRQELRPRPMRAPAVPGPPR